MDDQIRSLEDKINQFVALCQRLRQDNHELRQQLASSQNENKQLAKKLVTPKRGSKLCLHKSRMLNHER